MARKIRDDIAIRNIYGLGDSAKVQELLESPEYSGVVEENPKKITLANSSYGLPDIAITDNLAKTYESINVPAGEKGCIAITNGEQSNSVEVDVNAVKLIKALVLEQTSTNEEYSKAVMRYLSYVLGIALRGSANKLDVEDMSDLEKVVVESIVKFAEGKLPEEYTKGVFVEYADA